MRAQALTRSDGHVVVNQQSLEYARWRPREVLGGAPTLVLLHEGLGCVAMWKQFPEQLARQTGLEVVCYSRAGYGNSAPIRLPRSLDFHRLEAHHTLGRLIAALGIDEHILVGHSDGASIAAVYAGECARTGLQALVLMAPHVLTETKSLRTIQSAVAAFAAGPLRQRLARYHGNNLESAFRGWSETWLHPQFSRWNIVASLAAVKVPTLVLRGADDSYNTPVHVDAIKHALGEAATVVELSDCGHAPHVDQRDAVLAQIAALVTRLQGDRAIRSRRQPPP